MGIDYTVTLRNAAELAAWEQSAQAAAKAEKQLLKNAQQYKGVESAAKAFQQQQKAIAETESQIERERSANAQADVSRLQKKLEMLRRVSAEIQNTATREAARESQGYTTAFATGSRRGSYSSFPTDDSFQAGLRRMANDRRVAEETAKAAQNAFASGRGGLSGSAERDSWGEGMARITGQNSAAAKKAAEETAAAQRRLVEEVNRLRVTPLEAYADRMVKLKELLRSGAIDQRGFNAAAKEASERLAEAGKSGEDSFGERARAALQSYIAGFMSFTAVLALAKRGWDALIQAQEDYLNKSREIKDFNLSLAGAQANAILNLTGLSSERKKQVIEQDVPGLQQKTGFGDQRLLLNAVASGYAASGDIDLAMKAAEAAARINKNTPEQLAVQTGAALDIMRHTGEKNAETALSFLLQANPRGTDPVKIAQNLPPVLGMAKNAVIGDDDKEAARAGAAIFTVLGREGTDYYGEQSGTASAKLIEFQREFFTKHKKYDPGTQFGRMEALEKNDKLRKVFLAGLSKKGAVEYRPAIENIITPGTQANKEFHSEYERLQFNRAEYQQIEKDLGSTSALRLGNEDARSKGTLQVSRTEIENQKRSLRSLMREKSDEVIGDVSTAGASDVYEKIVNRGPFQILSRMGGKPEEQIQRETLERFIKRREQSLGSAEASGDEASASKYRADISLLEKQLEALGRLEKQLEDLNNKPAVELNMPAPNPNGAGRD